MSNLPCPAAASTFPDSDAPQADELPADYQPTAEDLRMDRRVQPRQLPAPRTCRSPTGSPRSARQIALLDDVRSQWLSSRIDELAKQAHFLGAQDPATFTDRDEVLSKFSANGSGRRGYRRPWIGVSVAAIGGIADCARRAAR